MKTKIPRIKKLQVIYNHIIFYVYFLMFDHLWLNEQPSIVCQTSVIQT